MLWCALHLPDLVLQVFTRAAVDSTPLAILSPRPRQRIVAAGPAAMARGVTAGLSRAGALALAPDLHLIEQDAHLELSALTDIACWAGRFTPSVSLDPPATLLLEIQASLRLFGGLAPLCAALESGLGDLGFSGRMAVAPTPLAARWLARGAPGSRVDGLALPAALDALPLATLADEPGLGGDTLELLAGIGARSLADIRRLPRGGLARREAQAVTERLDRAYGSSPDPRPWFVPPERYAARLPLPAPSNQVETLLFGVRRLLTGLAGWLDARQAGLEAFTLVLEFEGLIGARLGLDREARFPIVLGSLSRDMARCQLLVREHLSRQALPAPVEALRLEADSPRQLAPSRSDLFDAKASQAGDPGLLLAILRARLGNEAVHCMSTRPDHRPEGAWRQAEPPASPLGSPRFSCPPSGSLTRSSKSGGAQNTQPPLKAPRPLWLLPAPRPIARPAPEKLLAGPERIESGWWDGSDGEVCRDYFVACHHDQSLVWIFREGHPPHGWFLHGYFA